MLLVYCQTYKGGLCVDTIIEIEGLTKNFRENTVLKNISIGFERNKIHGIVGRNGSGKTVLFKCILGLMPFPQGAVRVRGQLVGKDIDVPDNIGMIIEGPGFLPNYSGYVNLRFLSLIRNKIGKSQLIQAMNDVGLDPFNRKWVSKYSMGMRQRLCIAQAIMEDPDLLILDEPMNGLDKQGVCDVRSLLLRQRDAGKTILLTSHNQSDIDQLCDTVSEMDAGTLTTMR
jgi:ABC-2 type transport system ATP-binding protein